MWKGEVEQLFCSESGVVKNCGEGKVLCRCESHPSASAVVSSSVITSSSVSKPYDSGSLSISSSAGPSSCGSMLKPNSSLSIFAIRTSAAHSFQLSIAKWAVFASQLWAGFVSSWILSPGLPRVVGCRAFQILDQSLKSSGMSFQKQGFEYTAVR